MVRQGEEEGGGRRYIEFGTMKLCWDFLFSFFVLSFKKK